MEQEMNANGPRISRQNLFKNIAIAMSERSSCMKKAVGSVLVRDNRIIATGYNGVLSKEQHSKGLDADGTTHTVHAEVNIIAFCAKYGIPTEGTTLYTTLSPCEKCAETLIQAGIKEVLYIEQYRDDAGLNKLRENDILIGQL
jgi:dCMP deaminase